MSTAHKPQIVRNEAALIVRARLDDLMSAASRPGAISYETAEEWEQELLAAVDGLVEQLETCRAALERIAADDNLVIANKHAFGFAAYERCQGQAKYALSTLTPNPTSSVANTSTVVDGDASTPACEPQA